jgi:hypothetical protein
MGSSLRPKSTRAKSARPRKHLATRETGRRAEIWSPAEVSKIRVGVQEEIENQRRVLVTVTTLLHCLHAVLEHQDDTVGEELNTGADAALGWVYLPDMTAILLERVHAVHLALDSVNLMKASKAFRP